MTLHVRDTCLCLHAQRAARVLARRFDEALRPASLTNGQFSMLMSMNRPGPVRMREVATLLGMDRTTLTSALKTLEKRGLVTTQADPDDRRGRLLALTDAGRDRLAEALPIWVETHREVETLLEDPAQLRAGLNALTAAMR
ncbi:MarR family winged helix-turn-helix transcriptional regulator [Mesorhizobium australicum]|uniref:Transcriptional regulator, MarR family n=1 Tax=Mesorhizobium australicum TaxID=536018 RepID=A0A1X7P8T2_9HYPH|nr:MarR family transcriptional regulator [Mesorhizobium australicum]SMH46826.1 transcriptional regulator, MarR family [Mesorhizobium australicum]